MHTEQTALFFGVLLALKHITSKHNEVSTRVEGPVADKHGIEASDLHPLDVTELVNSKLLISVGVLAFTVDRYSLFLALGLTLFPPLYTP